MNNNNLKIFLAILCTIYFTNLIFGQEKDSLILLQQCKGDIPYVCQNLSWHHTQEIYSKTDSLTKCYYTLTFMTNHRRVLYEKKYNLKGDIVSEGPIIEIKNKKKIFHRQSYQPHKQGIWKMYDYDKAEITYMSYSCYCDEKTCSDWSEKIKSEIIKK